VDQLHLIPLLALSLYLAASVLYARACFTRSEVSFAPAQLMVRSAFFLHALFVVALYRLKVPGEAISLQFPTALVLSSFLLVGFFITVEKRAQLTALGAILSPLAIVAMTISSVAFHLDRGEGLEANLTSVLTAHILTSVIAHSVFFISFAFSLALIVHRSLLKRRRLTKLQRLLPPLERLDQFNATGRRTGGVIRRFKSCCRSYFRRAARMVVSHPRGLRRYCGDALSLRSSGRSGGVVLGGGVLHQPLVLCRGEFFQSELPCLLAKR
jgi:ABC-type uncharacterized transport system permease subunit